MLPSDAMATWAPPTELSVVTKSDTTVLGGSSARAGALIYVGTGGDVIVDGKDAGTDITFKNFPSGQFLPVLVKRVKAATTAADMVACW